MRPIAVLLACVVGACSANQGDPPTEQPQHDAGVEPDALVRAAPVASATIPRLDPVHNPWGDCAPRKWRSATTIAHTYFPPRSGSRDSLATLMPDGKVLLGEAGAIYDPDKDTYEIIPLDTEYRFYGTATLLADKRTVLFAGGGWEEDVGSNRTYLFDYPTRTIKAGAPMLAGRAAHSATLLGNGRVLIAGGRNAATAVDPPAELYDPSTNSWARSGIDLMLSGDNTFAAPLSDGRVFIANSWPGAQYLYQPAEDVWTLLRKGGATFALALRDGRILIGRQSECPVKKPGTAICSTAEFFDPATKTFSPTAGDFPLMLIAWGNPQVKQLPCGLVVMIGKGEPVPYSTVTFDPANPRWTRLEDSATSLTEGAQSVVLPDGRLLVTHGRLPTSPLGVREYPLFLE